MFCHFGTTFGHKITFEDLLSGELGSLQKCTTESQLSSELNLILKFVALVCFFLDCEEVEMRGVTGPWTWQWQARQWTNFTQLQKRK